LSSKSIKSNHYFSYVKDKSGLRCVILLVPILGNITVGIYDLIQNRRAKRNEKAERFAQDIQAISLGLDCDALPHDINKRRQILEDKQQEIIQIQIKSFDQQIIVMEGVVERFNKIIKDPQEPLELSSNGKIIGTYEGSHPDKIEEFWSSVKLVFFMQEWLNSSLSTPVPDQIVEISQKQQELIKIKNTLLELRQTSYHDYVQTIGKDELLQEAQIYYLETPKHEPEDDVKQMDLATILPKLEEVVLNKDKNDYNFIELQEIISRIKEI